MPSKDKIQGYSFLKDRDAAIEALDKSQTRVANLEAHVRTLKEQMGDMNRRLSSCEPKAQHFDELLKAVKGNELVRAAWDKMMMTLRITGHDKRE